MDFSDFNETACIKETFMFYGNRIIDNRINPLQWTFTVMLTPLEIPEEGKINNSVVAYESVKFWIDNALTDTVFSCLDNELGVNLCYFTENPVWLTPYPPTENHLLQLIHSKLSAIAGDYLQIGLVTLESTDSSMLTLFNTEIDAYNLPEGDLYMSDMYHKKPWWKRSTFDYADYTNDEVDSDEHLQSYLDSDCPLTVFKTELLRLYDEATDKQPETAEIIKMPKKWSPKII